MVEVFEFCLRSEVMAETFSSCCLCGMPSKAVEPAPVVRSPEWECYVHSPPTPPLRLMPIAWGLCFLPWGSSNVEVSRGFQKSIVSHRISISFTCRCGGGGEILLYIEINIDYEFTFAKFSWLFKREGKTWKSVVVTLRCLSSAQCNGTHPRAPEWKYWKDVAWATVPECKCFSQGIP